MTHAQHVFNISRLQSRTWSSIPSCRILLGEAVLSNAQTQIVALVINSAMQQTTICKVVGSQITCATA